MNNESNKKISEIKNDLNDKINKLSLITTILGLLVINGFGIFYLFITKDPTTAVISFISVLPVLLALYLIFKGKKRIGVSIFIYSVMFVLVGIGYSKYYFEGSLESYSYVLLIAGGISVLLSSFVINRIHTIITGLIYIIMSSIMIMLYTNWQENTIILFLAYISAFIVFTIISLYVSSLFENMLTRAVTETQNSNKTLEELTQMMNKIRSLKEKIDDSQKVIYTNLDEMNQVIHGYSKNVDDLSLFATNIGQEIELNKKDINILLDSIQNITEKIESQSAYITQNASAQEEMVSEIKSITNNSQKASDYNEQLIKKAEEGKHGIEEVMTVISDLEQYQGKFTDIVNSIRSVSSQTNLLAMNANIEAAHAGDVGRGFGVVADEIRKLADETELKTKEIDNLIKAMNQQIATSINKINEVNQRLLGIIDDVNNVYPLVDQINTSIKEQDKVNSELLVSTKDIIDITMVVKVSSDNEQKIAEKYKKQFDKFKLQIDNVIETMTTLVEYNQKSKELIDTISKIQNENELINKEMEKLLLTKRNKSSNESPNNEMKFIS